MHGGDIYTQVTIFQSELFTVLNPHCILGQTKQTTYRTG
jgi:hypothetical protein